MLNALRIKTCCLDADADRAEKRLDDLVALTAHARQLSPHLGEKNAAVWTLLDITLRVQSLQHFGDRWLRHSKTLSNVHLSRLSPVSDEIGYEFDIVLDKFAAAIATCLLEAFHLGIGRDKRTIGLTRRTVFIVQFNSAFL